MSDMSECAGEMARLQVAVLCGTCQTPGAPPKPVYGLQVESDSHHWCWQDLDVDRQRVETLAHRLEEMNPEPCHLEDIIRDFVLEPYLL